MKTQWAVYHDGENYKVKMYERLPPNCPWPSGMIDGPYDESTYAEYAKRLLESGLNCPEIEAVMPTFINIVGEIELGYVSAVVGLKDLLNLQRLKMPTKHILPTLREYPTPWKSCEVQENRSTNGSPFWCNVVCEVIDDKGKCSRRVFEVEGNSKEDVAARADHIVKRVNEYDQLIKSVAAAKKLIDHIFDVKNKPVNWGATFVKWDIMNDSVMEIERGAQLIKEVK